MVDVPEDVSVKEYFEEYVPKIFGEQVAGGIMGMEGTELGVQFDITNGSTTTYSIVVKDAKELEVKEGPIDAPVAKLKLSEDVWRAAISGKMEGATDMFTDVSQMNKARYDQLKAVKGTLNLRLGMPDGSDAVIEASLNGADSPSTTFICSVEDWVALSKGELAGPTAFMSGKLKIEGDMPFAMSLASLTG
jgi:putative sterol carrier protein